MAEPEYTALDWQLSDAELEQLPPSALRLIVRKLLTHIIGQDQRIKELEAEVNQLRVRLDRNSANSNKPPSSDSPYKENTPNPSKRQSGGRKGHKGVHPVVMESPHREGLVILLNNFNALHLFFV